MIVVCISCDRGSLFQQLDHFQMPVLRRPAQRRPSICYPLSRPRLWLPAAISPLPNARSPPPSSTASVHMLSFESTSALASSSDFTTSKCPFSAAQLNGVCPYLLSFESTSALASSSDFTTSECPFFAAQLNGVRPYVIL